MTNQEIFELIGRFESSNLTRLKLSADGVCLELRREAAGNAGGNGSGGAGAAQTAGAIASNAAISNAAAPNAMASNAVVSNAAASHPETEAAGFFISAPMVGTYYAASAPQQAPFVMPGDRVYKGQTVCLMEAMKMISEIPAPCDCIIEEILKADGDLAAFGEPLFKYQPC